MVAARPARVVGHGPVGITVPDVTVTKLNGRYHTNAWVRPSSPGTTVTIGLREYRNGQPVPGSNTLGWTVEQAGWRKFGAIHVATASGSRLALEIMARDLPPGGYIDIDEVVLHLLEEPLASSDQPTLEGTQMRWL